MNKYTGMVSKGLFFPWRSKWHTGADDDFDLLGPRLGYVMKGWAGGQFYLGKVLVRAAGFTFPQFGSRARRCARAASRLPPRPGSVLLKHSHQPQPVGVVQRGLDGRSDRPPGVRVLVAPVRVRQQQLVPPAQVVPKVLAGHLPQLLSPGPHRCEDVELSPAGFEFPFVRRGDYGAEQTAEGVVNRLAELLAAATKARDAGCRLRFTVTGVAFEGPEEVDLDPNDEAEAHEYLAGFGVAEPCEPFPGRTVAELVRTSRRLDDRIRYDHWQCRLMDLAEAGGAKYREAVRQLHPAMTAVEESGVLEEFPYDGTFGWGVLRGKHDTLDWVFGMAWADKGLSLPRTDSNEEETK